MANFLGTLTKVAVSDDNVTYTDIGCIKSADLPMSVNMVDRTNNDDNGNMAYLPGDADATFSFVCNYENAESDAGQAAVIAAFFAKSTKYYRLRPQQASGEIQFVFQALINELSTAPAHDEVIELNVSTQVTGGITKSLQP